MLQNYNTEKGFGFVISRKGGEEYVLLHVPPLIRLLADNGQKRIRFFEKALNEVKPEKNTCVSYVREEGEKGALAKDLREEDPDRVMRVTAKVHYGKVVVRATRSQLSFNGYHY